MTIVRVVKEIGTRAWHHAPITKRPAAGCCAMSWCGSALSPANRWSCCHERARGFRRWNGWIERIREALPKREEHRAECEHAEDERDLRRRDAGAVGQRSHL